VLALERILFLSKINYFELKTEGGYIDEAGWRGEEIKKGPRAFFFDMNLCRSLRGFEGGVEP